MDCRAYSILRVKELDAERRVISGIASTPEVDRAGDIVESTGIHFKNPLPLLLYHDTTRPVGTVKLQKPSKDGLGFEAQIPRIQEPGTLQDRVEEAWLSIKNRLVSGVSIGFRPLGDDAIERIKETGGLRFLETEVLELSLVTVPANASARIQTIKSLDLSRSADAALGPVGREPQSSQLSGVTDASSRGAFKDARIMSQTNASERLAELEKERTRVSTRIGELMDPVLNEEGELNADQQKEYDTLSSDLEVLERNIGRLKVYERAVIQPAAKGVVGTSQEEGSGSRGFGGFGHIEIKDPTPPGIKFARALICRMASVLSGGSATAMEIAKARYPNDRGVQALIKAAVTPMSTTEGTGVGGSDLVYAQNLTSEFIEYMRPMTIVGRFGTGGIPSLRRVPFNVRITGQTSAATGYWVGQAKGKPLTRFDTNAVSLTWAKVAALCVISDELARFSSPSAEALVRDELAAALIERLDTDFIDPNKAVSANVSPASITNGIAALTPSGTDAAAVRADISQLITPFITANLNLTSGVLIMPNTVALTLMLMRNALGQREFPDITMNGGTLEGFPVIASQYAAIGSPVSNIIVLVNASDIFLSDDGGVSVDASREASLEMSDDPENDTGTVVSMYQTNQIALRAERYINWARRRTAAVQWLDGVAYSSGSPA